MLRVPSSIQPNQFESLNIRRPDASEMKFVAYRSDVYPERNEVFFEEHAVIVVLEARKNSARPRRNCTYAKATFCFFSGVATP